jgi:hypothetical protein
MCTFLVGYCGRDLAGGGTRWLANCFDAYIATCPDHSLCRCMPLLCGFSLFFTDTELLKLGWRWPAQPDVHCPWTCRTFTSNVMLVPFGDAHQPEGQPGNTEPRGGKAGLGPHECTADSPARASASPTSIAGRASATGKHRVM